MDKCEKGRFKTFYKIKFVGIKDAKVLLVKFHTNFVSASLQLNILTVHTKHASLNNAYIYLFSDLALFGSYFAFVMICKSELW